MTHPAYHHPKLKTARRIASRWYATVAGCYDSPDGRHITHLSARDRAQLYQLADSLTPCKHHGLQLHFLWQHLDGKTLKRAPQTLRGPTLVD